VFGGGEKGEEKIEKVLAWLNLCSRKNQVKVSYDDDNATIYVSREKYI